MNEFVYGKIVCEECGRKSKGFKYTEDLTPHVCIFCRIRHWLEGV
jgi:hypothetical protein